MDTPIFELTYAKRDYKDPSTDEILVEKGQAVAIKALRDLKILAALYRYNEKHERITEDAFFQLAHSALYDWGHGLTEGVNITPIVDAIEATFDTMILE